MNKDEFYELEEKEPFIIEDMSQLDWAFKLLSEVNAQDKEIQLRANAQRQQIDKWEKEERQKLESDTQYFEGLIFHYHTRQLAINPKLKTLSTPFGKAKSVTSKEQPEQKDKDALLKHLVENDMKDYIKQDAKWGDFKKSLSITEQEGKKVAVDSYGMVVDGVSIKPETTNYSIEIIGG